MKLYALNVLIVLLLGLLAVESAKILGIFNIASFSHFAPGQTLMNALVDKGHDVSVIAVYKNNASRFKLIHLEGFEEEMNERKKHMNLFELKSNWLTSILIYHAMGYGIAEATFKHPNVQALLKSNQKFDVVITEQFSNEAFHGFCHHFNAACVIYSAIPSNYWINPLTGNPENPAYTPQLYLGKVNPMNFLWRTYNTIMLGTANLFLNLKVIPEQNALMHKYIPDAPQLSKLLSNTDLILLNSHGSFSDRVPLMPSMIEIGGFHVKPVDKLPRDLQKFLDEAKEGVVYFSMGSVLKTRDMTKDKREAFVKAFGKLKQKVLWKFDEDIPGASGNVQVMKWIPQKDVLAHPNVKVFITHGGLFSVIESTYFGVPIIGFPIFGDQKSNMLKCEMAGVGIGLDYYNVTEHDLYEAIRRILDNKVYSQNAKKRSQIIQDQPQKPLDTFTYWIEHVARHKGAKHLRAAALDLAFYQYMLIDVFTFLGAIVSLIIFMVLFCVRKLCCRKKQVNVSKDKKKK